MTQAQLENLCIEIITTAQAQRAQAEQQMQKAQQTLDRMHDLLDKLRSDDGDS